MERLLAIMARLRAPQGGCPWDLEQTERSLVPHTLEEAYEVAEAIEHGTPQDLRDELGDLLFQVVFYARLAEERGAFDFHAVAEAISDKLVRRHPHVFGDARVRDAEHQTAAWERHKAAERKAKAQHGALDGVSRALPALTRAQKLGRRAARVGFDWPDLEGVLAKLEEEIGEVRAELAAGDTRRLADEVGDLLLTCANIARHVGVDAETALRGANHRFETRFRAMEARLAAEGRGVRETDAPALDRLWQAVKR
jgi:ATP diphosphatase